MYTLTQIVAPTSLPVSLDEVRRHLAIEDGSHDVALLEQYIPAAVEMFESQTARQIVSATWKLTIDSFPSRSTLGIKLPLGQFRLLSSVEYSTESTECVDVNLNLLRTRGGADRTKILPASSTGWPTATETIEQVDITWVCGWTPATVPKNVKQGIMLLVANYFEQREPILVGVASRAIEHSLDAIYQNWRLGDEYEHDPCG